MLEEDRYFLSCVLVLTRVLGWHPVEALFLEGVDTHPATAELSDGIGRRSSDEADAVLYQAFVVTINPAPPP